MADLPSEIAAMARSLQDFCDAVVNRASLSVPDAVIMLDRLHGEDAPIAAMSFAARACHQRNYEDARFWTNVYSTLVLSHVTAREVVVH